MEIQSLSVCVPGNCVNNCKCCVSKLSQNDQYENQLIKNFQFRDLYKRDFLDALMYAKQNGCNSLMYTGDGEPIINMQYMEMVQELNSKLPNPFIHNELQTSGVMLTSTSENGGEPYLRWLRNTMRIKVISLSLFDIFNSKNNATYTQPKNEKFFVDIDETCKAIKKYDFTLRLSINMVNLYDKVQSIDDIFIRAKELGANQIIFRKLYNIDNEYCKDIKVKEINDWIINNKASDSILIDIFDWVHLCGTKLYSLPFGADVYSYKGMSIVIDDNCMNKGGNKDNIKYLVLRSNSKLYTQWDDEGSILF